MSEFKQIEMIDLEFAIKVTSDVHAINMLDVITIHPAVFGDSGFSWCSKCGKVYEKGLLATIPSSDGQIEIIYKKDSFCSVCSVDTVEFSKGLDKISEHAKRLNKIKDGHIFLSKEELMEFLL